MPLTLFLRRNHHRMVVESEFSWFRRNKARSVPRMVLVGSGSGAVQGSLGVLSGLNLRVLEVVRP